VVLGVGREEAVMANCHGEMIWRPSSRGSPWCEATCPDCGDRYESDATVLPTMCVTAARLGYVVQRPPETRREAIQRALDSCATAQPMPAAPTGETFPEYVARKQGEATSGTEAATLARAEEEARAVVADARLGRELVAILAEHAGETGESEGAVECLRRIIAQRDGLHAEKRARLMVGMDLGRPGGDESAVTVAHVEPDGRLVIDAAGKDLVEAIERIGDGGGVMRAVGPLYPEPSPLGTVLRERAPAESGPGIASLPPAPARPTLDMSGWVSDLDLLPDAEG
jgi:hypothetical protein